MAVALRAAEVHDGLAPVVVGRAEGGEAPHRQAHLFEYKMGYLESATEPAFPPTTKRDCLCACAYLTGRPRRLEPPAVGLELGRQVGHGAEAVGTHVLVAVVLREGEHADDLLAPA